MLQNTDMNYLTIPANAESIIQYWIPGTLKYPIPIYDIS